MFDVVTGLLLTGICGLAWVSQPGVLLLSFGLTLPWIIRRRYPLPSFLIAAGSALALVAFYGQPVLAIVAVPMLTYSYARWSDRTLARAAVLLGLLGSVLGPGRWLLHELSVRTLGVLLMTTLACAGMVSLAYVLGRRRRERDERAAQSVEARIERERLLAAEQEQRARVSAINERTRIARELHDIVAHSLSVIVVQAEGGRALAAKRPEKAPEVLATIADTSREALEEMRQMVGLLRSGGSLGDDARGSVTQAGEYLPMPGLADLQDLVDKTGDRFTLTVYGEPPTLSPAVGLTAYRIVQESLTNVLKHAGPAARAAVSVTYAPDGIGIRVIDNGRGPGPHPDQRPDSGEIAASSGDGRGHGLRGMRERIALHQGSLVTQARPEGGFEVLAWLPTAGRRDTGPQTRMADPTAVLPYRPATDQDLNRTRPMGYLK
jgi:signal transduction histidine kinase